MEYTKDNYLYGSGSGDNWHVNIDPPKQKVRTYYEETLKAVEYVYDNKTGKFTVLLSGGLDSQYVCEILLRMKIDFDVIIIELRDRNNQSYNQHDYIWAYEFCQSKNLKYKTYIVNFDKLVDSGKLVEIATPIKCCSPVVCTVLSVVEKLDGYILLGNDPPYLRFDIKKNVWYLEELQYIHGIMRHFQKLNLSGCPFLLSYTPEMMLSFLIDPSIVKLGTGQFPGRLGSNSTKAMVFNNGSNFNMPSYDFSKGPRYKQNGFELIRTSPIRNHPNLSIFWDNFFNKWNGEYLEPYADAVKRLSIYQE
jgi:hypothetical protein